MRKQEGPVDSNNGPMEAPVGVVAIVARRRKTLHLISTRHGPAYLQWGKTNLRERNGEVAHCIAESVRLDICARWGVDPLNMGREYETTGDSWRTKDTAP